MTAVVNSDVLEPRIVVNEPIYHDFSYFISQFLYYNDG